MYARNGTSKRGARTDAGFTLIELLIVVVVLGVLAAVVIFALGGVSAQAAASACKSDARTVQIAVTEYEVQSGGAAPTSLDVLTQGSSALLQSVPSSPYYSITLDNGVVMVAAPITATPVAFDNGAACEGANGPGETTSVPTSLPTTTIPSTTTTTEPPPTTTVPSTTTTTTSTTTTTVPPTTTTTSTTTTTTTPPTTTTTVPSPTISFPTSVHPYDAGHNRGRETLTITGTNLENLSSVNVSGAFSSVSVISDTSTAITITLTGSGGNNARGNLTVTTPGGSVTSYNSLVNGGSYNG